MAFFGIKPDKWKHLLVGIVIGAVSQGFLTGWLYWNPWLAAIMSIIIVAAIAYAFELFSLLTGKGHYELWDAIYSVFGGLIGAGIVWLFIS